MATVPILRDERPTLRRRLRSSEAEQTSLTFSPTAARHGTRENSNDASAPTSATRRGTKPASELVGIARLAASSPRAEAKRGTEYFLLPVKSVINHCDSPNVPFRFTVNPYRGCEFGCHYCYARYTHEFMEVDGDEFESKVYVKQDVAALVDRDLATKNVWGKHIAIGTATDPYQPAEKDFGATRAILERLALREGLSISITTKSNRVVRDLDVLRRINERSCLSVNFSIGTPRADLARILEPRAPRPDLRFEAVRELCEAGITTGVLAMPIVPGITDGEAEMDGLAKAASYAGAHWFAANVVYLRSASLKHFLDVIAAQFPKLLKQYQEWYLRYGNAPADYRAEISARVKRLREKYGLESRPQTGSAKSWRSPQMKLNLEEGANDAPNPNRFAPYW